MWPYDLGTAGMGMPATKAISPALALHAYHQVVKRAEGECLLVSGRGDQDLRKERPVGLHSLSLMLAGESAGNPL